MDFAALSCWTAISGESRVRGSSKFRVLEDISRLSKVLRSQYYNARARSWTDMHHDVRCSATRTETDPGVLTFD
uniref:Uncharacterized protein n=1 Tax=Anopheles atroparvus TaxID=41427 RepID=A0AAG5D7Q3_ANOAO